MSNSFGPNRPIAPSYIWPIFSISLQFPNVTGEGELTSSPIKIGNVRRIIRTAADEAVIHDDLVLPSQFDVDLTAVCVFGPKPA